MIRGIPLMASAQDIAEAARIVTTRDTDLDCFAHCADRGRLMLLERYPGGFETFPELVKLFIKAMRNQLRIGAASEVFDSLVEYHSKSCCLYSIFDPRPMMQYLEELGWHQDGSRDTDADENAAVKAFIMNGRRKDDEECAVYWVANVVPLSCDKMVDVKKVTCAYDALGSSVEINFCTPGLMKMFTGTAKDKKWFFNDN
jgi:hypothetical protein